MSFRNRPVNEPEINLIPFIDVLLVILIFLMLSTTYSKFTEMQVNLPVADTDAQKDYPKELIIGVSADGNYSVNRSTVNGRTLENLVAAMTESGKPGKDTVVIISADANAKHQSVVTVMEAARRAGIHQITFATQSSSQSNSR